MLLLMQSSDEAVLTEVCNLIGVIALDEENLSVLTDYGVVPALARCESNCPHCHELYITDLMMLFRLTIFGQCLFRNLHLTPTLSRNTDRNTNTPNKVLMAALSFAIGRLEFVVIVSE